MKKRTVIILILAAYVAALVLASPVRPASWPSEPSEPSAPLTPERGAE